MIDSHCHLAAEQFSVDLDAVIQRAFSAGITYMVTIADTLEEGDACAEIAQKNDHIFYTMGVHPHAAREWKVPARAGTDGESGKWKIVEAAKNPKMVAVGEIGLDYHYMNSPKEDQICAFRDQIAIAQELHLPIVVHNRESIGDMLPIIRETKPQAMVVHCCTEKWEDVAELVDAGYLLSFTGIATYPSAQDIRNTILHCPLEQMMIETDAPYLSPKSKRGERNEPAYVGEIAQCIADTKEVSLESVIAQTTQNAKSFYCLPE